MVHRATFGLSLPTFDLAAPLFNVVSLWGWMFTSAIVVMCQPTLTFQLYLIENGDSQNKETDDNILVMLHSSKFPLEKIFTIFFLN